MNKYNIIFWNLNWGYPEPNIRIAGCSVSGFALSNKWYNPEENAAALWNVKLKGLTLHGTFQQVLESCAHLQFQPKLGIIFFSKTIGVETFLNQLEQFLPNIPLIGGGAAFDERESEGGELSPKCQDVSLLLVSEGNYKIESLNIFIDKGIIVEIKQQSPREFNQLRVLPDGKWENALDFYRTQQHAIGVEESNFEQITFSDNKGRNIHCSTDGSFLKTGSNLPEDNILHLRTITHQEAENRLSEFIASENSLIFGCAGIRSLIKNPVYPGKNSLLGFMFGELVTIKGQAMFGNLMLAKLTVV